MCRTTLLIFVLGCTAIGCGDDSRSGDASVDAASDGGTTDAATDATMQDAIVTGDGSIDLNDGSTLPMGRVRCFFGPTSNCTRPGEECCEAKDVCWFPATEPDFCSQ